MDNIINEFSDINDLNEFVSDEEINNLFSYVNRYFSDIKFSNAQLENCIKLSNYVKRNELKIGEIEAEKLLSNDKINNMLSILNDNKLLLRVGQFFNIAPLLDAFCIKNNIVLTRDGELSIYSDRNSDLDLIKIYLNEIADYENLTAEEEIELSVKAKNGDEEARNKLIEHNLRLVVFVAKNFVNCGVDFGDLIQYGNEGLLVCIDKFDPSRGYRFSTYATYWIRQGITRGIAYSCRNIRVSFGLHDIILKIKKTINRYILVNNGKIPTYSELAEIIGISIDRVKSACECMDMTVSLSTPVGGEDDACTLGDIIPDSSCLDTNVDRYYMMNLIESLIDIASLSDKEIYIIKARNGFYGRIHTLAEIGEKYECTRECIRQYEKSAMLKLKSALKVKETYDMFNKYKKKEFEKAKTYFLYRI